MRQRSNDEWREELGVASARRDEALTDLRACLLRAARFYLRRHASMHAAQGPEQVEAPAQGAAQEAILAVLATLDGVRSKAAFLTRASKLEVSAAAALLRRQRSEVSLEAIPGWDTSLLPATRQVCDDPEATAQRREAWCLFQAWGSSAVYLRTR